MRKYQRVSNNVPRHHRKAPKSAAPLMKKPIERMMREAKHTVLTGGRSDAGTLLRPGNNPFMRWVRTSDPAFGIDNSKRFTPATSSGQAKIWKSPGLLPSQCASMAAILIG